jgi:hypothetical protein
VETSKSLSFEGNYSQPSLMITYIAFSRAINVGGRNQIKMGDLNASQMNADRHK